MILLCGISLKARHLKAKSQACYNFFKDRVGYQRKWTRPKTVLSFKNDGLRSSKQLFLPLSLTSNISMKQTTSPSLQNILNRAAFIKLKKYITYFLHNSIKSIKKIKKLENNFVLNFAKGEILNHKRIRLQNKEVPIESKKNISYINISISTHLQSCLKATKHYTA